MPLAESAYSAKTMTRFAFSFLMLLLAVGCQTAARAPKSTIIAHAPATPTKQFWSRTTKFLQPLMPDTGNRNAKSDNSLAFSRSHSDILPINHTSHSLYKAGSIFPSSLLTFPEQEKDVSVTETVINGGSISSNPLRAQAEDSDAFKGLLRDIAATPADQLKVNDTKLTELLTLFRKEMEETKDADLEAEYLAFLRKKILPEVQSPKSTAPLPNEELATDLKQPGKILHKKRDIEPEYDEDFYEEPIVCSVARKKQQSETESVIAQNSMPMATPVYPSLTQLPGVASATIQASYQNPYQPPQAHSISGYGAGDWQAPTRMAIEQLRYAIEQTPNGKTLSNEMRLRMLEMLLGNKAEATKPMLSGDKTVNGFIGNQILGFSTLLDDSVQDNRGKYISAAYRFNEGLLELQKLCPVKLKNVMLVKECYGYGQFVPHTGDFRPGEQFLLYMELENPTVRRTADGFEVSVAISYEIRDAHANIVDKKDAGKPAEMTVSRKRDHNLVIQVTLPASLAPGQYQLRINLTDMNDDSMQYAEEQLLFRVVPSLEVE